MAFIPRKFEDGKVMSLPVAAAGALVKGSLAKMSSGYLIVGAAGDNEVNYVSLETVSGNGTDGGVSARVLPIDEVIEWEVLTTTGLAQASHVGNDYDIATGGATIDLAATTDKVFHIDAILNATDLIATGHFNKPGIA